PSCPACEYQHHKHRWQQPWPPYYYLPANPIRPGSPEELARLRYEPGRAHCPLREPGQREVYSVPFSPPPFHSHFSTPDYWVQSHSINIYMVKVYGRSLYAFIFPRSVSVYHTRNGHFYDS